MSAEEPIWFVASPGQTKPKGPYTWGDIQAWVANGTLRPQDLCWREGMKDWAPLFEVDGAGDEIATFTPESTQPFEPGMPATEIVLPWQETPAVTRVGRTVVGLVAVLVAVTALVVVFRFVGSGGGGFLDSFRDSPPSPQPTGRPASPAPTVRDLRNGRRETLAQTLRAEMEGLGQEASDALAEGNLSRARRAFEQVVKKGEGKPQFASQVREAQQRLRWIDLTQHPERRYVILGATVGARTLVRVRDTRDGVDYRPRVGAAFGACKLLSYDADDGFAEIQSNGRTFTIQPPE